MYPEYCFYPPCSASVATLATLLNQTFGLRSFSFEPHSVRYTSKGSRSQHTSRAPSLHTSSHQFHIFLYISSFRSLVIALFICIEVLLKLEGQESLIQRSAVPLPAESPHRQIFKRKDLISLHTPKSKISVIPMEFYKINLN